MDLDKVALRLDMNEPLSPQVLRICCRSSRSEMTMDDVEDAGNCDKCYVNILLAL